MLEPYWVHKSIRSVGIKDNQRHIVGHRAGVPTALSRAMEEPKLQVRENVVFRKRGYLEPYELVVYSNARAPVDFICKPMKFDAGRNNLYSLERTRHA